MYETKLVTPWGVSEYVKQFEGAEGTIIFVGTMSHGGYGVRIGSAIHKRLSAASLAFSKQWSHGYETVSGFQWFEEDCGFSVLALDLPDLLRK